MNRFVRGKGVAAGQTVRCWPLLVAALLANCGGHVGNGVALGGETHFLVTCGDDCGPGLSCIDGVCTRRCEPGFSSCSELATLAECVSAPDEEGERAVFGGTCDVRCAGDAECTPLGSGYACRSGVCRAEPEDRLAALAALSPRTTLARTVDADTCDSGLRWVGGDHASAEMRPGSDCVGCHRETGARPLLVGGTVYPIGKPGGVQPLADCFGLEGIEVIVADADGRERSTLTNRAGNFYFEGRESDFPMPYTASIRFERFERFERFGLDQRRIEADIPMATQPSYGGCARCHNLDREQLYTASRNDETPAEAVLPAGAPVYPVGLYEE